MGPGNRRKFNPWAIEKSHIQENGSKHATKRLNNESEFVFEISIEKESKILPTKKSLCSQKFQERFEVEIFACNKINQNKGLIYIHDYNIRDIADYGK